MGGQLDFPVVDADLRVVGMVSMAELGRVAKDQRELLPILLAADLATPVEPVGPEDSLLDTIRKMGARGTVTLPVVDPHTGRLMGIIDRGHVLALYEQSLAMEGGG